MFKAVTLPLVFVTLIGAPAAAGSQQHDAHDQTHAQEQYRDAQHEAHKHKMNDPEFVERNRIYDAAWAKWRSELFGLAIERGMVVADIGAGDGDFSIVVAQKVGPKGLVYANEIEAKKLVTINDKAAHEGLSNVVPILGRYDDTLVPPQQVDMAIMVEVFHHVSDKQAFLENLRRRVKPGARLVIIEADINQEGGNPDGCYTDPDAARRLVEKAGFRFVDRRSKEIEGCTFFVLTAAASEIDG
jgi:ubiquinone/menaquinone biosynthesis C-methylase UbiE